MGKNETVDGGVRRPVAHPSAATPTWVPPWETSFAEAHEVAWSKRTYRFSFAKGFPVVAQEDWLQDEKTGEMLKVDGSLKIRRVDIQMTYADVVDIVKTCRETGKSLRNVIAKRYLEDLSTIQKSRLTAAPDTYIREPFKSAPEDMVTQKQREEFFASI